MGIPISIDAPSLHDQAPIAAVQKRLQEIDEMFSTYKPQSEISRYQRGELREDQLNSDVRITKKAVERFEKLTNGYFSATYNGAYDPTGYIKGWAIAEAGKILEGFGITTYLINAAGDIQAASSDSTVWRIGIQNPLSQQSTLGTIALTNGAIATSGTYERGAHIIDPHTHRPAQSLISATVHGPDIIMADVLATTCIAMGSKKAIAFMNTQPNYESLLIDTHGAAHTSRHFAG